MAAVGKEVVQRRFPPKGPGGGHPERKRKGPGFREKNGKAGRARETPEGVDDLTKNNYIFG